MTQNTKKFICPSCGKSESVSKYSSRKLCSPCNQVKRREKGREHDKKRRAPKVSNIVCQECSSEFVHKGIGTKPKYCLECRSNYSRNYESKKRRRGPLDPKRRLNVRLKHIYGMSLEMYSTFLESQDGVCLACGKRSTEDRVLYVDHDHACCPGTRSCGKCVRGLICQACNSALGQARDSVLILNSMKAYLEAGGVKGAPNIRRFNR